MVTVQEAVIGTLGAVASILYAWVAIMQARRRVSDHARPALWGFVAWWAGLSFLGFYGLIGQLTADPVSLGLAGFRLFLYPIILLLVAMCAGLVHYLLFLYTGRRAVLWWTLAFFVIWAAALSYSIEGFTPAVGDDPATAAPGPEFYTIDEPPTWLAAFVGLGLILPLLGAAVAYALLYFRTDDATGKYRIALVSTGFVLWFLYSALGSLGRLISGDNEQSFTSELIGQLLGLLAASLTLLAYKPPRIIRAKGIRGLQD